MSTERPADRDPLLEQLRSVSAFASDVQRTARAVALLPNSRSWARIAVPISAAAAALLAFLAWWLWSSSAATNRPAEPPRERYFTELPPALAAIEDPSLGGAAAAEVAFLRPTHDVFVLTPDGEPRLLLFPRPAVRGE